MLALQFTRSRDWNKKLRTTAGFISATSCKTTLYHFYHRK